MKEYYKHLVEDMDKEFLTDMAEDMDKMKKENEKNNNNIICRACG